MALFFLLLNMYRLIKLNQHLKYVVMWITLVWKPQIIKYIKYDFIMLIIIPFKVDIALAAFALFTWIISIKLKRNMNVQQHDLFVKSGEILQFRLIMNQ